MKTLLTFFFTAQTLFIFAQLGCTDPLALNFNPVAVTNDGSCLYNDTTVSVTESFTLSASLVETSGLIQMNSELWTHNDSYDTHLYRINPSSGATMDSIDLTNTTNTDWEDIAQDTDFLYIGDFGNNSNGNRTDLKILRVEKSSFSVGNPIIDTISYSYPEQTDFTGSGGNNTNFDCEAMLVQGDSIYLFTKQWQDYKTTIYALPKTPGIYSATRLDTLNVEGLITGATHFESENIVALSGYSPTLQPFIYLLYDYTDADFFGANKRKINLSLAFHQVEGITTDNGLDYFLSNEIVSQSGITINQRLHRLDLYDFLSNHIFGEFASTSDHDNTQILIFPNPSEHQLRVAPTIPGEKIQVFNAQNQSVLTEDTQENETIIDVSRLSPGIYFMRLQSGKTIHFNKVGN